MASAGDMAGMLQSLLPRTSLSAQIKLRGAVQPWIDAPIRYPFRVTGASASRSNAYWQRLAEAHQLGEVTLADETSV
jgi:hypothetical protein